MSFLARQLCGAFVRSAYNAPSMGINSFHSSYFDLFSFSRTCLFGTKALFKTNQAAAKRFRVRGSGSIKRAKAGRQHNTGYKSRERCNRLGQLSGISEPQIEKRMRRAIGQ